MNLFEGKGFFDFFINSDSLIEFIIGRIAIKDERK